jgi:hypothetical protein
MTDDSVAFQWSAVGEVELTPKGGLAFPKLRAAPGLYRFRLAVSGERRRQLRELVTSRRYHRPAGKRGPGC